MKSWRIIKVFTVFPEGNMNIRTKLHGSPCNSYRHYTQNHKCQFRGGIIIEVRGSPKSLGSILWVPPSVLNVLIHPEVVTIQFRLKWWTNPQTLPTTEPCHLNNINIFLPYKIQKVDSTWNYCWNHSVLCKWNCAGIVILSSFSTWCLIHKTNFWTLL